MFSLPAKPPCSHPEQRCLQVNMPPSAPQDAKTCRCLRRSESPVNRWFVRKEPGADRAQAEAKADPTSSPSLPDPAARCPPDRDSPPGAQPISRSLQIPPLPHRLPHLPHHATASSSPSEAMTPAKIAIIFFAVSSLLLLSHARFVPDDFFLSTTAVSQPHQPEDAERTAAVVPPEKTTEGSISAAVEPFHQVDLSLRRPIGRHIHRPIDPNILRPFRHGCRGHRHGHLGRREIPYGDDMIRLPRGPKFQRGFPGEMRQIPMRGPRMPEEFLGEMRQIPSRTPEFERGLWKERPAMVHGMREAEGREVSREEKAREKLVEGEDGDLVKRFWTIVNRF